MSIGIKIQHGVKKLKIIPLYGLLYNWYAVNDSRGLAPEGWHVPSQNEFHTLQTYLGGINVAGGKLKEIGLTHWQSPNTGATDAYGFKALPAGIRGSQFTVYGQNGYFCCTSVYDSVVAYYSKLFYNSAVFWYDATQSKYVGAAVRCLMDSPSNWYSEMTIKDIDGNLYHTIKIGTQVWIAENLAVTHYRNGDEIPEVTDNTAWTTLTTGALCAYNNNWSEVFV